MADLKNTLTTDLTAAMRAKDEVRKGTLRMALSAITNEEVSGKEVRVLTDDEVLTVLGREAKKRREAATAYDEANRPELAERERAELAILEEYLPQALSAEELSAIISAAVAQAQADGAEGPKALGVVMKLVTPQTRGRADGAAVTAAVRTALGLG